MKSRTRVIDVAGIVHPSGACGYSLGSGTLWGLGFSFQPWRRADGTIEEKELRIEKEKLSERTMHRMQEGILEYDVLRARVILVNKFRGTGRQYAKLVKLIGPDRSDVELNSRANQLRRPVRIKHPALGTLTLNRALNQYDFKSGRGSKSINVHVSLDSGKDEAALLKLAERVCKQREKWDRRCREFVLKRLLKLKNESWLDEGEARVTSAQFKKRIRLVTISISGMDDLTLYYDDGDLFCRHVILVRCKVSRGPVDATIAG